MAFRYVALCCFFTSAFFFEYLPPIQRVHIPFDLEWYHYPLADYAFQALRQGRFPQWDPTIYCGLSFVGNVQAGLFYPLKWVMIILSLGMRNFPYTAMEYLVLAHVLLGFLFCYIWLHRRKRLHWLASILGSGVFAFSGYMLQQLQHLGLIIGYAWMPFGFAAIDEAHELRSWKPLWKLSIAFTMCILGGYPPTWIVFAVCMFAYGTFRRNAFRSAVWVTGSLFLSLLFSAVQLLPGWEATRRKMPDVKYGRISGIKDPRYYLSYIVPNYYDFGIEVDIHKNPGKDYLYLGAPAFVGMAFMAVRRRLVGAAPLIGVLLGSLLFVINPFGLPGRAMENSLVAQVFTDYYFLAGITAAVAGLAAIGLDFGLTRVRHPWPRAAVLAIMGLSFLWAARLVTLWIIGSGLPDLWRSALDSAIATILCGALISAFARSAGRLRWLTAISIIILAGSEYKAFGTSKRFNAAVGTVDTFSASEPYPGMNSTTYFTLRQHPEYRLAREITGPEPLYLRHVALTTPQGFDPFLPIDYKELVEHVGHMTSTREFDLDPQNETALQLLGVRYFGTSENGPLYSKLLANPHFRLLHPDDSYYKIFEFSNSRPGFDWDPPQRDSTARAIRWEPERRVINVRSDDGGSFRLSEQFLPGWEALVDGVQTKVERCEQAFQCVVLTPGEHSVEFRYRSPGLIPGVIISFCSLGLAIAAIRKF